MEKRLFLAIGLSLIIVWLWSAVAPKQNPPQNIGDVVKNGEYNERANIKEGSVPFPSLSLEVSSETADKIIEKVEVLNGEKLIAEFSNIGASLNKVTIKEYDASLPISKVTAIKGYENVPFTLDRVSDGEISYSFENSDLKIVKKYMIHSEDYIINAGVSFINKSNMSKLVNVSSGGYTIEMSNLENADYKTGKTEERDRSLQEYVVYSDARIYRKAGAFKFSGKEAKEEFGRILWSGFRDRYFCALIKPQYGTIGYDIVPISDTRLKVEVKSEEVNVQPHGNVQFDSIIYVGPEKINVLKKYGLGFEKIKKYYRFLLFDVVAKIIESLMRLIYKVIPNWGACIIIISIVIYFSMYPLTMKGMMSMKRMQSLQPLIVNLKEKYKDNPQKMNKEMMELYKEHKVNPLGGCFPMLLQMPVFIGLYQVLWRSVSFKGAHFLWIKDLSQPDRLFMLPFNVPMLGNEFNVLPVIMMVVMFFQQKLSSKNMVVTDPSQAAQQKMMTTIMPVFLGVIFYKFASGLTLYFTMFYFFSTFTQWKLSKDKKGA